MAAKGPFRPKDGEPEGVDINFDDDLDGWGESDEEAEDPRDNERTDVIMAPGEPDEEEPAEEILLVSPQGLFGRLPEGERRGAGEAPRSREAAASEPAEVVGIPIAEAGSSRKVVVETDDAEVDEALSSIRDDDDDENATREVGPEDRGTPPLGIAIGGPAQAEPRPEPEAEPPLKKGVSVGSLDWSVEDQLQVVAGATAPEPVAPTEAPAPVKAPEVVRLPRVEAAIPEGPPAELDLSAIDPLPLDQPLPEGERNWLNDFSMYRQESQKLARQGRWRSLAAITSHALLHAAFADRLSQVGMLLDLARIYRDRLGDGERAEVAFKLVVKEEPANQESLAYLVERYRGREEWSAIFELYMAAVEATWDPNERLSWTREAARMAMEQMADPTLAIRAWEHLWQLGDAVEESARELSRLYRRAGRWAEMAAFLEAQVEQTEGAVQMVVMRELAEVRLSGLCDPDGASQMLERIVDKSPQDPIATLQLARVYTQRQDWDALERLGNRAASQEVAPEAALDLQHQVAEALWQAGKLEQAVLAYDRILEVAPTDSLATARKQEYLTRTDRHDELLALLITKADSTDDDDLRADLLAQAAELAEQRLKSPEQSAKLWERRITIDAEHLPSYQALVRLYEVLGDLRGVARALEGQLGLTREPRRRIELLRQLGRHYAERMGDDDRAERFWKEILGLDPNDAGVRDELIDLHRRRGNFEALNSALVRQIWLTSDSQRAVALCRQAALNLDVNFDDPARSVDAWRRVLDFCPTDLEALAALKKHYRRLERRRDLIAVIEHEVRSSDDPKVRVERAMEAGSLWLEEGVPKAAAGLYEVVLRWQPGHAEALGKLEGIYMQNGQRGKAVTLLEQASLLTEDPKRRVDLLRRILSLLPDEDHVARFFHLRRILLASGGEAGVVAELLREAEAAGLWKEIPAVLSLLISEETDLEQRRRLLMDLAGVWETKLGNPDRAYLTMQRVFLSSEEHPQALEEAVRLARATTRIEDLLVLLDRMTTPEFSLERRKEMLRRRAQIFEADLSDNLRALQEHWRLLALDPSDLSMLGEVERLAREHDLWAELDVVLAELVDRSPLPEKRLELLARRERINREKLERRDKAFDLLMLQHRLAPRDREVLHRLSDDAETLEAWSWVLPLLEARSLFQSGGQASLELAVTADLYEEKLGDLDRAFQLNAAAFVQSPDETDLAPKLEGLAERGGRFAELADMLRLAAAGSQEQDRIIGLLQRTAAVHEERLGRPERAIDVHTRLLYLKGDLRRSLEVMVDWHRNRNEWRDLRDRLRQRIALCEDPRETVPWLLEIAEISDAKLGDAEEALQAFGQVLEVDAQHDRARQGLEGLVRSIAEPNLRLRWLEMQQKGAEPSKRSELMLEIAQIQEVELEDMEGAIATLRHLVTEQGAGGQGFAELKRLLTKTRRWKDLVLLLHESAEILEEDGARKLQALQQAMAIAKEHLPESETDLWLALYQAILVLTPGEREIRADLARILRRTGRFEALATQLLENLAYIEQPAERVALQGEVARLQALTLERSLEAQATWKRLLDEAPEEEGAVLALAREALARRDLAQYIDLRHQQARLLPPREAALVLCHLAEVADENEAVADQMVPLYREARTLDPHNIPAMEALKGIGRRLKTLRPAAALLPLEGERDLTAVERARRLKELGDEAKASDLKQAVEWYLRATATDPDFPEAWEALALAQEALSDARQAYRARRSLLQVRERTTPLQAETLVFEAGQLFQLAQAARRAGLDAVHGQLVQRAFDLAPHYAPAALAIAQLLIEAREVERAQVMLHTILGQHAAELSEEERVAALYSRGVCLRRLGRTEAALDDIREVLRLRPLHAEALAVMGEMLAQLGRTAAAIEIQIRALTTVEDARERARLYYRLGVLWEDGLGAKEEAGVCYELALAEGLEQRDLLHRALRHLQRTGRLDQSLAVVDGLLPTAEDPEELATLWLVRGEIFAAREGQEEAAVEAFDMALSYNPAHTEAREGLIKVLERRRDWAQLLQVLEATCDVGTPEQQSLALQRMAAISKEELGDPDRAEEYLRQSVAVFPSRPALEELERVYTFESGRLEERREVLGLLAAFGPPWFDRALELAKLLLSDEKAWAWCLLSPLLGVSQVDPDIKAVIQAMRKEFERPPMFCPRPEDYGLLRNPECDPDIEAVLAQLGEKVKPLGVATLDAAGDGNAIPIGEATTMGKAFAQVAEAMGLPGVLLHRTQSLHESVCVVNSDPHPSVVVRTEVMQQLVHAEVGFLFCYVLDLSRPGKRVMAALPKDNRDQLLPALFLALGFSENAGKQATKLAARIKEAVSEEDRAAWAERLTRLRGEDPLELGRRWWRAACATARRAGLLAGADLRQVFRVLSRLEEDVPRPRVVARIDELDQYVGSSDILKDLVAFAASPSFGKLMKNGIETQK